MHPAAQPHLLPVACSVSSYTAYALGCSVGVRLHNHARSARYIWLLLRIQLVRSYRLCLLLAVPASVLLKVFICVWHVHHSGAAPLLSVTSAVQACSQRSLLDTGAEH